MAFLCWDLGKLCNCPLHSTALLSPDVLLRGQMRFQSSVCWTVEKAGQFCSRHSDRGSTPLGKERRAKRPKLGAESLADSVSPVRCTCLLAHFCHDFFPMVKGRTLNNCVLFFFFLPRKMMCKGVINIKSLTMR